MYFFYFLSFYFFGGGLSNINYVSLWLTKACIVFKILLEMYQKDR